MDYGLVLFIAAMIGVLILIFVFSVKVVIPFKNERDCIKMELARSYEEEEYLYWEEELRRLYLKHIPFLGKFMDN